MMFRRSNTAILTSKLKKILQRSSDLLLLIRRVSARFSILRVVFILIKLQSRLRTTAIMSWREMISFEIR